MTAKSVKLTKKGTVYLPAEIRKELGLKEGERLLISHEGGKIILQPVKSATAMLLGLTAGSFGRTAEDVQEFLNEQRAERKT